MLQNFFGSFIINHDVIASALLTHKRRRFLNCMLDHSAPEYRQAVFLESKKVRLVSSNVIKQDHQAIQTYTTSDIIYITLNNWHNSHTY